jgi:hypothetical protein
MVRMTDEPRQSTQYVCDVGWIAATYGEHAKGKDHDGRCNDAQGSEPEHNSLPCRPHSALAASRTAA